MQKYVLWSYSYPFTTTCKFSKNWQFFYVNFVVNDSTIITTSSVPNDDKVAIVTSLRFEWLLCYLKYLLTEWLKYCYISDNLAQ